MHTPTDLTIYIPRVSTAIQRQQIFEIFSNLLIEHPNKVDTTIKRVLVKFKTWVNNKNSNIIIKRFDDNKDIKIVYAYPWFWTAYKWVNQPISE